MMFWYDMETTSALIEKGNMLVFGRLRYVLVLHSTSLSLG